MELLFLFTVKTENQVVDVFTKPLPVSKFKFLRQSIEVSILEARSAKYLLYVLHVTGH